MDIDILRRRLSSEEVNALPLCQYEGHVHVVRSEEDWLRVRPQLLDESILGFDTETRPSFRKGRRNSPALIQLATAQAVYLVQLAWLPFGADLAELLANPAQVKAGVGIRDDMRDLAKLYDFEPAGLVDLGGVARAHKMPSQGLRTLAANFFGWRISKGSQCSNWSLPELSDRQIAYAATDAWIGRLIFVRMCELGLIPTARPAAWPVGDRGSNA
ncbi:MAG: 3'-5' exonuclease domain-containing protein 2 [Desulfovibrio sp.]|nr:3'-5' exonuclease domain-containing protein 2 [Desulfovibrio sp.]